MSAPTCPAATFSIVRSDGTTKIVAAYYMVIAAYLPWAYLARNDNHIICRYLRRG